MAEAVGLALGTVALASLFTTCVECLGYFELSTDYESDYNLACLKLSLLKSRLDNWGQFHLGRCADGHLEYEEKRLHQKWIGEDAVIGSSLQGIVDILGDADLLRDKYRLEPRKSRSINQGLSRICQGSTFESNIWKIRHLIFPVRSCRPSLFRRSTIWAIRDRQKFQVLIDDLDFLISNLEAISTKASPSIRFAMSSTNTSNPAFANSLTPPQTPELQPVALKYQGIPKKPDTTSQAMTTTAPAGTLSTNQENPQQPSTIVPKVASSTTFLPPLAYSESGFDFHLGKSQDTARASQGPLDGARFLPAPEGQKVSFTTAVAAGNSRVIQGVMTSEQYKDFLKQ